MKPLGKAGNGIVVGLLHADNSGALAYAMHHALADPSSIRQVRPIDEAAPGDPVPARSGGEDLVEGEASAVLLAESRDAGIMIVQTPADEATALQDPVLSRLRQSSSCLFVEVDDDGQVVRASGPNAERSMVPAPGDPPLPPLSTTVTVGFDGSAGGLQAVRWAIATAQDEALTVQVVMAYAAGDQTPRSARLRRDLTLAAIARAIGDLAVGRATLVPFAIAGEPSDVLLNCAENSRLLVLGRHGTSGMIHSALGSVGDTCARLAACPVVVVPTYNART